MIFKLIDRLTNIFKGKAKNNDGLASPTFVEASDTETSIKNSIDSNNSEDTNNKKNVILSVVIMLALMSARTGYKKIVSRNNRNGPSNSRTNTEPGRQSAASINQSHNSNKKKTGSPSSMTGSTRRPKASGSLSSVRRAPTFTELERGGFCNYSSDNESNVNSDMFGNTKPGASGSSSTSHVSASTSVLGEIDSSFWSCKF